MCCESFIYEALKNALSRFTLRLIFVAKFFHFSLDFLFAGCVFFV
nr:MAG TPA: hypothetical protein [Caudoviricetes sp.]